MIQRNRNSVAATYNARPPMTRIRPDSMTAFLISIGVVALAEIGDKTQLLAIALAAKYRKPWPVIFGIFFATLANALLAGAVGSWLTHAIGPTVMRWALVCRSSRWPCGCWCPTTRRFRNACNAVRRVRHDADCVLPR